MSAFAGLWHATLPSLPMMRFASKSDPASIGTSSTGLYGNTPSSLLRLAIAVHRDQTRAALKSALGGVGRIKVASWHATAASLLAAADDATAPQWDAVLVSDDLPDLPAGLILKALRRRFPSMRLASLGGYPDGPSRLTKLALGVDAHFVDSATRGQWTELLNAWIDHRSPITAASAQVLLSLLRSARSDALPLAGMLGDHEALLLALADSQTPADAATRMRLGLEPFWSNVQRLRATLSSGTTAPLLEDAARQLLQ